MAIDETEIRLLRERVELLEHEQDGLLTRVWEKTETIKTLEHEISNACELLGHEGRDGEDLLDAIGGLERLLVAHDLDSTDLQGIAQQLQRLIQWAHLGARSLRLVMSDKAGVPVVLSEELSEYLDSPLTGVEVYNLTTAPLDGLELDDKLREWFDGTADMFNGKGAPEPTPT